MFPVFARIYDTILYQFWCSLIPIWKYLQKYSENEICMFFQ